MSDFGKCPKCGHPIEYKTVSLPMPDLHGAVFMRQAAEGLWCEQCQEWQPW